MDGATAFAPPPPLPSSPQHDVVDSLLLPPAVPAPSTSPPPPPPSSSLASPTLPPSQTLYLNHLNEKTKVPELKKSLYLLFSQFGNVLDVRAVKNDLLRGQAWVVMADVASAVKAQREMDGFSFYHRLLHVQFARHDSDVALRSRGEQPPPRERRDKRKAPPSSAERKAVRVKEVQQAAAAVAASAPPSAHPPPPAFPGAPALPPYPFPYPPAYVMPAVPNKVLFVENLPGGMTVEGLGALFAPHAGYVESRLVPVREGVAFVEFEDEGKASQVLSLMQHFRASETNELRISYAKK